MIHRDSHRIHAQEKIAPAIYLLLYLVIVLATAAIIAPLLYKTLGDIITYPFHRYLNRCYLIAALLCLPLLLARLKIKSFSTVGWKYHQHQHPLMQIALALLIGIITTAMTIFLHVQLGWHQPNSHLYTIKILTAGFLPAILIAPIEEILFRGVAQYAFSRSFSTFWACVFTAFFFALLHFIKVPPWPPEKPIHVLSGLQAVSEATSQAFFACFTQPRGLGLLIAGLCLSYLRYKSDALWLPIGLHAGWILGQKAVMRAFDTTPHTPPWPQDLLSSPIAWAAMLLATCLLTQCMPRKKT